MALRLNKAFSSPQQHMESSDSASAVHQVTIYTKTDQMRDLQCQVSTITNTNAVLKRQYTIKPTFTLFI